MNKERIVFYSHLLITCIGVALIGYLFLKYLFLPFLPFLIAWAAAFLLRPLSVFIAERTGLSRKLVSCLLAIISVAIGIGAIVAITVYALSEAWKFLGEFVQDESIFDLISKITEPISEFFADGYSDEVKVEISDALKGAVGALLSKVVDILTAILSSVPKVLFFILVTVIAAVYFAIDLDNINARVRSILPKRISRALSGIRRGALGIFSKYVKAYLLLMLITFFIMLLGLLIMRVENAFLLAAVISALDALPILGVGAVLLPWCAFQLFFGSFPLGIGLAILYLVNTVVHQFAEPKIVGKSLGIHPVVSLVLLYVGYSVFGIFGLLLVPFLSILVNILFDKNNSSEIS